MKPWLYFWAFVAFLLLVGYVGMTPLSERVTLTATASPASAPVFDAASIRNHDTTKAIEAWFNQRFGFRWLWVGLDREVTYSLFGELPRTPSGSIILTGRNDWFFEEQYVTAAIKPGTWEDYVCVDYARQLARVQNALAKRGIAFAYVVAPSKVEVYPEFLPDGLPALVRARPGPTDFLRLRPYLRKEGVCFYDGPERYASWKTLGESDLFARSGSHWSYVSVARVAQELLDELNLQLKTPVPPLVFKPTEPRMPRYDDRDLFKTANLLVPKLHLHPLPVAEFGERPNLSPMKKLKILWVNDSFGWQLINTLHRAGVTDETDSLFYFRNCYRVPERVLSDPKPEAIDWEAYLKGFDAVILLQTEISVETKGWGFVQAIDSALGNRTGN